jgi:hypothetical protein
VIVPAPPILVTEQETTVLPKAEEKEAPAIAPPAEPLREAITPELDASPEVTVTPVEAVSSAASEAAPVYEQRAPEPAAVQPEPVAQAPHPQFIPVFKDPEPSAAQYDFVPTAAPAVDDVEIPREPALQETAEEATRNTVADHVEPGLMRAIEQIQPEPVPTPTAADTTEAGPFPLPVTETIPEVSDADFEARVAAAMAAYNQTAEVETAHAQATDEHEATPAETHQVAQVPAAAEEVPSFEYQPLVRNAEPEVVHEEPAAQIEAPAAHDEHAAVAASVEAAVPEAAAAVAAHSGADHHTIAQAVHRVMERLKPELVEEIMKELKSKK